MANCPTLFSILAENECEENLAGLGEVCYIGLKKDLKKPMEFTKDDKGRETCIYDTPEFLDGTTRLSRVDLKEESQKIAGESQGKRKGFNLTGTMVFDAVNKQVSKLARSLNNLDWFAIFPDPSGKAQILYDANKKIRIESGGATSDTGAAAADDRITTINFVLGPVMYPNLFVEEPQGGWESLVGAVPQRKVTVTSNDNAKGTVTIKDGDTTVASGSNVYQGHELTLTATPTASGIFDKWSDNETANPRTIMVGDSDITLTANFNASE